MHTTIRSFITQVCAIIEDLLKERFVVLAVVEFEFGITQDGMSEWKCLPCTRLV